MDSTRTLALISWLNIYTLVWVVLLYPPIQEKVVETILAFFLFFIVAVATNRTPEKKEND